MVARFLKVPTFDIYEEETGRWARPEDFWLEGEMQYQSDHVDAEGNPLLVTVPNRFVTDFSSIPRFPPFFRAILLKNGTHRPAAVPHDYLCRLCSEDGITIQGVTYCDPNFPRVLADKIFLEAMEVVGVKRWQRYPMYWAVRINTERLILMGKAKRNWSK